MRRSRPYEREATEPEKITRDMAIDAASSVTAAAATIHSRPGAPRSARDAERSQAPPATTATPM